MDYTDLLNRATWHPLSRFGYTHHFFTIDGEVVIYTWITLIFLFIILLATRYALSKKEGIVRFLALKYIDNFKQLNEQAFEEFHPHHFYFITTVFTYILICNTIVLIPWLEEPTKDLNTTLALGIICFVYTQYYAIKAHGVGVYLKEYFSPIFVMFPLHVVGKLATVISMSFRLFGNIYGGATISAIFLNLVKGSLTMKTLSVLSGIRFITYFALEMPISIIILLFFGLFEGFIQAFVFSTLALTYLSMAIKVEHEDTI